jgi:hypothetical protein
LFLGLAGALSADHNVTGWRDLGFDKLVTLQDYLHATVLVGELHGVGNEIDEDLFIPVFVTVDVLE